MGHPDEPNGPGLHDLLGLFERLVKVVHNNFDGIFGHLEDSKSYLRLIMKEFDELKTNVTKVVDLVKDQGVQIAALKAQVVDLSSQVANNTVPAADVQALSDQLAGVIPAPEAPAEGATNP